MQGPFQGSAILPAVSLRFCKQPMLWLFSSDLLQIQCSKIDELFQVKDAQEAPAPATVYSKRGRYRSFEAAKVQVPFARSHRLCTRLCQSCTRSLEWSSSCCPRDLQVDKDLRNFKRDAAVLLRNEKAAGVPQDNNVIEK